MTNTPKLAIAIGYIDDDLVTGAVEYMPAPSKKFTHLWKHFVAVAAVLCIAIIAVFPQVFQDTGKPIANDNEPGVKINLEEIGVSEPFGSYFPTVITDGYELESEVQIYDNSLLEAVFVNYETGDTLIVRIAPESRYSGVETGKVLYRTDKGDGKSSYLYVDCDEYIVYYSSAGKDLTELPNFEKMIKSSSFFNN